MKKLNYSHVVALTGFLAMTAVAGAQTTVTQTSTTTSAGTVSAFTPDTITVHSTTASPISYSYSKTTTYVDENGNPVSIETVRSGVPVTVYYTQDGDRMLASKVVVRKSVSTEAVPVVPATTTVVPTTTIETHKSTTTTEHSSSNE